MDFFYNSFPISSYTDKCKLYCFSFQDKEREIEKKKNETKRKIEENILMRGYSVHFSLFMPPMEVILDDMVSNSILFTINFLRLFYHFVFFFLGLQFVLQITITANLYAIYLFFLFFSKAFKKHPEVVCCILKLLILWDEVENQA